jgi:DNA polymerase-3 subunit gamma/tau
MQDLNLELNLARRLRPKTFDEVIGQDISVRLLKNGLYRNTFFPLYIFAGQRGCGKTTSARIFGAAINCRALSEFQKDPTRPIPCLACDSCAAYLSGNHPDFIEIDAASHTGVDNVRAILESAHYLPVSGFKKIYLIDEAHMLSKAAFNAFLKILEEPPASVLFMLATTELIKIPDTVRSRAFQLFFNSVDKETLSTYLANIGMQEGVAIDGRALALIVGEGEGSVRDTINIFERLRLSGGAITEDSVLQGLGRLSPRSMCRLAGFVLEGSSGEVLAFLESVGYEALNPQALWDMLVMLLRALVWTKYGVQKAQGSFGYVQDELAALAKQCSAQRLSALMNYMWSHEEIFLKTAHKHVFFEMMLIELSSLDSSVVARTPGGEVEKRIKAPRQENAAPQVESSPVAAPLEQSSAAPEIAQLERQSVPAWDAFMASLDELKDPLLSSIFKQVAFDSSDEHKKVVRLKISRMNAFFKQKLQDEHTRLIPLIDRAFAGCTNFEFIEGALAAPVAGSETPKVVSRPLSAQSGSSYAPAPARRPSSSDFVIDDAAQWPKATLLKDHFSGRIEKINDTEN